MKRTAVKVMGWLITIPFLAVFFMPYFALASFSPVISTQYNFTVQSATTTTNYPIATFQPIVWQKIGTGLTGTPVTVSVPMTYADTGSPGSYAAIQIFEFADSTYTSGQGKGTQVECSTPLNADICSGSVQGSPWSFDETKYYAIRVFQSDQNSVGYVFGSGVQNCGFDRMTVNDNGANPGSTLFDTAVYNLGFEISTGSGFHGGYGCLNASDNFSASVAFSVETATSSSLFSGVDATTTLEYLADQCSNVDNVFGKGLCIAFAFLFVPSPATLNGFSAMNDQLPDKFPFSYFYSIYDLYGALSTTTSSAVPSYSVNYASIDVATSTRSFLPSSPVVYMSTTTVVGTMGETNYNILMALQRAAFFLMFALFVFHDVRERMHRHAS